MDIQSNVKNYNSEGQKLDLSDLKLEYESSENSFMIKQLVSGKHKLKNPQDLGALLRDSEHYYAKRQVLEEKNKVLEEKLSEAYTTIKDLTRENKLIKEENQMLKIRAVKVNEDQKTPSSRYKRHSMCSLEEIESRIDKLESELDRTKASPEPSYSELVSIYQEKRRDRSRSNFSYDLKNEVQEIQKRLQKKEEELMKLRIANLEHEQDFCNMQKLRSVQKSENSTKKKTPKFSSKKCCFCAPSSKVSSISKGRKFN